jgi:hypothetical protein
MYNDSSNPVVRNTIIAGNRASTMPDVCNVNSMPVFAYSLVQGSGSSVYWNTAFGQDGRHNLDGMPLFIKNGFDGSGNMQRGNYRLASQGQTVDGGWNNFMLEYRTRWNCLLENPSDPTRVNGTVFDLAFMERFGNDIIDIGAYEFTGQGISVQILRDVHLPEVEGLTTDPPAGTYYITTHTNFVFNVMPEAGSSIDSLIISTGIPLRDREGVKVRLNPDGSRTVTILQVYESIHLTFEGIRTASAKTDNSGLKVWAYDGYLFISSNGTHDVYIYNSEGRLYKQQTVTQGKTSIRLPRGLFIVSVNKQSFKIVIS